MRVTKEQSAENRARILKEAARLFREQGFAGIGVDAVSQAAGLTHGNLYSQFGSKEKLMAEVIANGPGSTGPGLRRFPDLAALIAFYLSPAHRDNPGGGCMLATLASDARCQAKPVRQSFTISIKKRMEELASMLPGRGKKREDEALAVLSTLVGAMVLARAVDDKSLSDRILQAGRAAAGA